MDAYSVSRKYPHTAESWIVRKNSKINFSGGWYVYEKSNIEYIIIYVNKTAIWIRYLIYWRGSRVGLFGRESEKKNTKTSKTLCETDRKENRPCINPSHFQSEKWQPPRDGGMGQNTRYLHAYVSGDIWSDCGTFYEKLTVLYRRRRLVFWQLFDTENIITWHTGHPVFRCIFYFPPFFFSPRIVLICVSWTFH